MAILSDFLTVFHEMVDEFLAELGPKYEMPEDAIAYIKKVCWLPVWLPQNVAGVTGGSDMWVWCRRDDQMMEYTVPGGKLNRGLTVVHRCAPPPPLRTCTPAASLSV